MPMVSQRALAKTSDTHLSICVVASPVGAESGHEARRDVEGSSSEMTALSREDKVSQSVPDA